MFEKIKEFCLNIQESECFHNILAVAFKRDFEENMILFSKKISPSEANKFLDAVINYSTSFGQIIVLEKALATL